MIVDLRQKMELRRLHEQEICLASRFVPVETPIFDPPFTLIGADLPQRPVVVTVPHAARDYPPAMREMLRFGPDDLRSLEDRHADWLAKAAAEKGFTVMVAGAPRLWIDLNRDPSDFDRARVDHVVPGVSNRLSGKGRSGLGLIPDRLSSHGSLWRRRISWNELQYRVESVHAPWHKTLAALLARARGDFGLAVLIDLHSMPPLSGRQWPKADIVIGDRFGSSAGDRFASLAVSHFEHAGLRVQRNLPYAGGYMLDRHGSPRKGVHALQLEVCRRLYLDSTGEPNERVEDISALVADLAEKLSLEVEAPLKLAAE